MIFYGWGTKNKKQVYMGRYYCRHCGAMMDYYVIRRYFYISLFFIPFIRIHKGFYIGCGNCLSAKEIEKAEYLKLCNEYSRFPTESQISKAMKDITSWIENEYQRIQKEDLKKHILTYCNFDAKESYLDDLIEILLELNQGNGKLA